MILQALNRYYERKAADPSPERRLPAFGLEDKEIPFIIELAPDGRFLGIVDTRTGSGRTRAAARFLVPKAVKKTSGVKANLLWETAEYALGLDRKGKPERTAAQAEAFRSRIDALPEPAASDMGILAVKAFLASLAKRAFPLTESLKELAHDNPVISFRLAGDDILICQRPEVVPVLPELTVDEGTGPPEVCLVTGERMPVELLHSSIKGVWGAQSSGANIVSFNLPAFESFGKVQGANAPVSQAAAFRYTTALNHLLRKDSRQRLQVADASTVFWTGEDDEIEDIFGSVFGRPDDPDRTDELRALLEAIHSGKFSGTRGDKRFFMLGLAPNAARLSIRFWHAAPLREIARRIGQWFADLEIVRGPRDPEYPSLFRLLAACSVREKGDNIPPRLGGDVVKAALDGGQFPASWLNAAVTRCRAQRDVDYYRAAAIKACLIRNFQYSNTSEDIKAMLDPSNPSIAYRLGRLFATLEKIQEEANPGLNTTIRERYYGAASSTPVVVFTTLLRLKNHHVAKFESKGRANWFEKLIGEIMAGISAFPSHLALPDQGMFAIGYYHQRQAFYTKRAPDESITEE